MRGRVRHEPPKTKGSRHIATVAPIADAGAALALVDELRVELPGAGHHAWAYRLGAGGGAFRCSDDGEPSGSAGRPILQLLEGRALTDLVVVVSRIFGGTKLGFGGLVRAYSGAAAEALDRADVVERIARAALRVEYDYADAGGVDHVLRELDVTTSDSTFGARIVRRLELPAARVDDLVAQLRVATGQRAAIERET